MGRIKNDKLKLDRINTIINLLVRGKKRIDIVVQLSEEWDCSYIWVDKYIRFAKLAMKEQFDNENVEDVHAFYEYLKQRALNVGNDRLALDIENSKRKLKDNVQRVDITSNGESIGSILEKTFGFNDNNR